MSDIDDSGSIDDKNDVKVEYDEADELRGTTATGTVDINDENELDYYEDEDMDVNAKTTGKIKRNLDHIKPKDENQVICLFNQTIAAVQSAYYKYIKKDSTKLYH
jgi:hypothetical protein